MASNNEQAGHEAEPNAEDLSRQAREQSRAGHLEEAVSLYQRALALDAQRVDDWVNQGLALWSLGRNEASLECYDRALALAPGHALAWLNRGNILADQGQHEAAVDNYDKALAIDSSLCRAWFNKGDELGHLRRFIEAKACFENACDLGEAQSDTEVVTQARIMVGRCDDILMNEDYS